jgi:hypothetical protein
VIGFGPADGTVGPAQPAESDVPFGPTREIEVDSATRRWRVVWFDDPDGPYLVAAALARYLDANVVSDVILVPTERGPALQIPADAAKLSLVRGIVVRFGGTIGPVE